MHMVSQSVVCLESDVLMEILEINFCKKIVVTQTLHIKILRLGSLDQHVETAMICARPRECTQRPEGA